MGVAQTRELLIGISYKKQVDLVTQPTTASDHWRVTTTNPALADFQLTTEDDAQDIGKGDEFVQNVFPLARTVSIPREFYMSSQLAALFCAAGLGSVAKTTPASGAYTYTCTPLDPVSGGLSMPALSYIEQARPGGSAVLDRAFLGCIVQEFGFKVTSGLGRQNSTLSTTLVGTGQTVEPSAITLPATLQTSSLGAGGLALTCNGIDYIAGNRISEVSFSWNNSPRDDGYYPGSGQQGGFQIKGRQEHGDRVPTLNIKARYPSGSTELSLLQAQSEGTVVLSLTGGLITGSTYHKLVLTGYRTVIKSAQVQDVNGMIGVDIQVAFKMHSSNGLLSIAVTTDKDNILATAS